MKTYFTALVLGLALITPIGPQNIFVLTHGLTVGLPRALWSVVAAGTCDTLLIVLGVVGGARLVDAGSPLRLLLLAGGVAFLTYLGIKGVSAQSSAIYAPTTVDHGLGRIVRRTAAVSLLNPHAIIDTVGVIGTVVAAQPSGARLLFGLGTVTSSWVWFIFLATGGHHLRRFLNPQRAVWIERFSGVLMLGFAIVLTVEFLQRVA